MGARIWYRSSRLAVMNQINNHLTERKISLRNNTNQHHLHKPFVKNHYDCLFFYAEREREWETGEREREMSPTSCQWYDIYKSITWYESLNYEKKLAIKLCDQTERWPVLSVMSGG